MIGKSTHVSVIPKEPKEGSQFICLSVILIDSVFKKKKKNSYKIWWYWNPKTKILPT